MTDIIKSKINNILNEVRKENIVLNVHDIVMKKLDNDNKDTYYITITYNITRYIPYGNDNTKTREAGRDVVLIPYAEKVTGRNDDGDYIEGEWKFDTNINNRVIKFIEDTLNRPRGGDPDANKSVQFKGKIYNLPTHQRDLRVAIVAIVNGLTSQAARKINN